MPKRYFVNSFADFSGVSSPIDNERLKQLICHICTQITRLECKERNCDGGPYGGIYVGIGGVAYGLWYLSAKTQFQAERGQLLSQAQKYIDYHVRYGQKVAKSTKTEEAAFILGNSGLYTTAALIYDSLGDAASVSKYVDLLLSACSTILPVNFLHCGSDELFVGRAGYLCAILNLRHKLGKEIVGDEVIVRICRSMIESGRRYRHRPTESCPLLYAYYGTEYLGAAHGLSSILQMLLSFPECLRQVDDAAENDVRATVDFLLKTQQPNGNFPCAVDEIGHNRGDQELIHWCHGAPGTIYLMARAYKVWNDNKYLQACRMCGEVIWQKGLLKKGPGICHGVAGNGYAFLVLYQLTGEEKYLHRAYRFVEFMNTDEFKFGARTPDSPLSLYEGLTGTLCFYSDMFDPAKAEFPLFPANF